MGCSGSAPSEKSGLTFRSLISAQIGSWSDRTGGAISIAPNTPFRLRIRENHQLFDGKHSCLEGEHPVSKFRSYSAPSAAPPTIFAMDSTISALSCSIWTANSSSCWRQYSFCPLLRELPEPNLRSGVQGAIADCLAILDDFRDHRRLVSVTCP